MASSRDKLLALINADNPWPMPLNFKCVSFSDPLPDLGQAWNTKVTVSAIPGFGFTGHVDVFYHRIGLPDTGYIGIFTEEQLTPETLTALLALQKNIDIPVEELEDFSIPMFEAVGDMGTVVLAAKSNSYGWMGTTTAEVLFGFTQQSLDDLHTLLTVTMPSVGYF